MARKRFTPQYILDALTKPVILTDPLEIAEARIDFKKTLDECYWEQPFQLEFGFTDQLFDISDEEFEALGASAAKTEGEAS